jgi:hypothetical protein
LIRNFVWYLNMSYKSNILSAGFQPSKKLGGNLPWTFLYDNRP